VRLGVEPLNTRIDHIGYFLESTREGLDIADEIDRPEIGIVYDIYHSAVMVSERRTSSVTGFRACFMYTSQTIPVATNPAPAASIWRTASTGCLREDTQEALDWSIGRSRKALRRSKMRLACFDRDPLASCNDAAHVGSIWVAAAMQSGPEASLLPTRIDGDQFDCQLLTSSS
jgi:hydroxypyruvate isomerase